MTSKPYIIAEIGPNHNGSFFLAKHDNLSSCLYPIVLVIIFFDDDVIIYML